MQSLLDRLPTRISPMLRASLIFDRSHEPTMVSVSQDLLLVVERYLEQSWL
jgi:hypothetical protein